MKYYRKRNVQPMYPWVPGTDMEGVSVSADDKANGSPKMGDMIAFNEKQPTDRWLVCEAFFKANYEEVPQ